MVDLHPQAKALLAQASALPPVYTLTIEEARTRRPQRLHNAAQPLVQLTDIAINTANGVLPVRAYHPRPGQTLPILIFFHGGGWILNDLDTHDSVCNSLAGAADCVVVSVDYRRSPEHKYPAQIEDARSALEWASRNGPSIEGDTSRIAVGGDSAGGTIAAALAKVVRDKGGPRIRAQLLLYPVVDYSEPETESYKERGVGYGIDRDFMKWVWAAYLPATWSRDDPYLFPLQGDLADLPAAVICTAEYDLLRDEGLAYAEKLRKAGVPVESTNADDQMHGFAVHTDSIDRAAELVTEAGRALKRAMA